MSTAADACQPSSVCTLEPKVVTIGTEGEKLPRGTYRPEPPIALPQPPASLAADVVDLDRHSPEDFTWGEVPPSAPKDGRPGPAVCSATVDAEYGQDVPAREAVPTVGVVTTKLVTARQFFRSTRHYRILDLPGSDSLVFYNRNSVPNAQMAFQHRVARYTLPFRPDPSEVHALERCADAMARFLGPV